jgi:hypothetical protein
VFVSVNVAKLNHVGEKHRCFTSKGKMQCMLLFLFPISNAKKALTFALTELI